MKELPREEIEAVLRQSDAILQLLEQAGKCRRCDWPLSPEGEPSVDLNGCRNLAFLVALKVRSELGRDYSSCVRALGSGLALAKHLGAGPTLIHLLVGVGVSAVIYEEIELYMQQQPGAPSLKAALRDIREPLFDEKHSELYGMDEAGRSRAQLLLTRANRHLIVLQYLETLRSYAATARQWPQTLDDLKTSLPNDPVSGKPFSYKRLSDTQAVLEGPLPKGGDAKDNVRYELTLIRKL